MVCTEISWYMQEPHKYCWEITLQCMDNSCKFSVLLQPQPSPTHLFSNKIPTLRTLAMVRGDGFFLSTWGQGTAVLGLTPNERQAP